MDEHQKAKAAMDAAGITYKDRVTGFYVDGGPRFHMTGAEVLRWLDEGYL